MIPFKGLKMGKHDFEFKVEKGFFERFENSEVENGRCIVTVILDRKTNLMDLKINILGTVEVVCDRCLDHFDLPLEISESLYVKFGDVAYEQTDKIIILPQKEFELDISQYIYEYIILNLPYQRYHPLDKNGKSLCNQQIIEEMGNYYAGRNDKKGTDPRWDGLKNLMRNNK